MIYDNNDKVAPDNLPRWIDNLKGNDPTIDSLIEYIIEQGKQSAPGTPEAPAWRAVSGPGQVEVGARLRFNIGDKHFHERAKLILNAGTDKEEVIYDKGRNFYFITSCVMSGFSNHKNVEYLPSKRAAQLDGGQGEGEKA